MVSPVVVTVLAASVAAAGGDSGIWSLKGMVAEEGPHESACIVSA